MTLEQFEQQYPNTPNFETLEAGTKIITHFGDVVTEGVFIRNMVKYGAKVVLFQAPTGEWATSRKLVRLP